MFLKSFKNAVNGITACFKQGRNFRIICAVFVLTITFGFIVSLSLIEWAVVLICCAGVISAELINSSLENTVDLCTKEYSPIAKKAKDMAAGATLVFSIFSAAVGLIIFIPHIISLFRG